VLHGSRLTSGEQKNRINDQVAGLHVHGGIAKRSGVLSHQQHVSSMGMMHMCSRVN
jgi:hypothetical protein